MKGFIHLSCHPHPQFWDAPISQQAMGCVLATEAGKSHVPSPCSAHRLPLEISYLLLFLVFPLFWPESGTMHFPPSRCEQSPAMVLHPLCESPEASSETEQQEFLHPPSWHWFFRHLLAQRPRPAAVLTHPSLLQSQSHPNWSVLQHHTVSLISPSPSISLLKIVAQGSNSVT